MSENIFAVADMNKLSELQYKKKPIIAQFYTEWCPPCKPVISLLQKEVAESAGRFILAKINADEAQQLNMQYQIQGVPTTILLRGDSSVQQKVIGNDKKKIKELIEKTFRKQRETAKQLQKQIEQ